MKSLKALCFFLLASALPPAVAIAESQDTAASILGGLEWRAIGPAVMGGRIDDVAVVEDNPSTIFVGAASGGLWKTTNNGVTWEPVFDNEGVASIGDIALAPSNPDLVWVGTGEPNNRQSSTFGDGIYKSTDGGGSWKHMGLRDTQHIGRIVIDPVDPDIVYVAALGHLWGPNRERGLYRTTDGGETWTNTLFIDEDTGFSDLVMDPSDRHTLYAAAYQRRRTAWGFNGGGPGGGIYKTADGGKNWKKLTGGLPGGTIGRIGLAISRKHPEVLYATVEHREGGIFRSGNRGADWTRVNRLNPRPMYYSQIRVDPNDENRVYVLGAPFYVSADGGRTFADPATGQTGENTSMTPTYDVGVHGDHHALWIDPADSRHLVLGGDGGLYFSYDGSVTWRKVNNIPLAQFYAVTTDTQKPYFIYGGLQDTHSWGGPSATRHYLGILNSDWFQIDFGDGMYAQADPTDPATVYIESNGGNIMRVNTANGDRKNIEPHPEPGEEPYRFNWTAPLQISPHDPKTIYLGGNRLFKSTDRGETWTAGPDLTKGQDRDKFPIMGVTDPDKMLSRNDGVSSWGTLTSLAESPVTPGLIWAGSDDGNVQLSRDAGRTWTNVTDRIPGLLPNARVSRVEPSHKDAGTAYVTFDRHQDDDFAPYVFVTADFGQTWKSISADLPRTGWVNVIRQHPRNPNLLFAGTETGAFASFDAGASWRRLKNNLPTVPVDDIVIQPQENDLILGTHGRSVYILDDITPLEELSAELLNTPVRLFQPRPAAIFQFWKDTSYSAQAEFAGPNPPRGAILNYYVKDKPAEQPVLTILDGNGKVVRKLEGNGDAGIQRVIWDLRLSPPENVANAQGPFVLPGKYTVRLSAAGTESSRTLTVEPDPLMPLTEEEWKSRQDFLLRVSGMQSTIQRASSTAGKIVSRMESLEELLKTSTGAPENLAASASSILGRVREIQGKLAGRRGGGEYPRSGLGSQAGSLFSEMDGSGIRQGTLTGPTEVQLNRLKALSGELDRTLAELNTIISKDLPGLAERLNRNNIPRWPPFETVR